MDYLSIFSYKYYNDNSIKEAANICFSIIFSRSVLNDLEQISVYLLYNINTKEKYHDFKFTKEDVITVFKSFENICEIPEISDVLNLNELITNDGIKNRLNNLKQNINEDITGIKVTFNFTKEHTYIYKKFVITLCRYFYENGMNANHLAILTRYYELLQSNKYPDIPKLELLQLCHFGINTGGGHSITPSLSKNYGYKGVVSEKTIKERFLDTNIRYLHSYDVSLFDEVESKKLDFDGEDIDLIINKYINNEITCIRK